ncbi:hypothetical protein MIND_01283200 [Mycena indigotica]|uniref:Uncharacterized protein n=1 Tax=Mycena indigotica TaxID=2126181 RepID=A0A8H6S3J2_9AGAR|nr:uncharacterized protein MIND_01283200 [Mycena indigotica]KAF7291386.1 hypothetical protein MIND_01283200 [Mycena indigotica]
MTEYDYSEEALQAYLATQDRISRWAKKTHEVQQADPETPRTPALSEAPLPRHGDERGGKRGKSLRDRTRSSGDGSRDRRRHREREVSPPPPLPVPPRGIKLGRSHSGGPLPRPRTAPPPRDMDPYAGIYSAPRHSRREMYHGPPTNPPSPTHHAPLHGVHTHTHHAPNAIRHRRSNSLPQPAVPPMHQHAPPSPQLYDPLQPTSYTFALPPAFGPVPRPGPVPIRPGAPVRTNSNPTPMQHPIHVHAHSHSHPPHIMAPQPRPIYATTAAIASQIPPIRSQHQHQHSVPPIRPIRYEGQPPGAYGSASAPHLPPPAPRAATPISSRLGGGSSRRLAASAAPGPPMPMPMPKEPSWLKRVFGFRIGRRGS